MANSLVADPQGAIEAARIGAEATVEAARISAASAKLNAIINALTILAAAFGAGLTAYVTYNNALEPFRRADAERQAGKAVLVARLRAEVIATISFVENTLRSYKGNFDQPVELRVLRLPATLVSASHKDLVVLGPDTNHAIATLIRRLEEYKRAKQPIQNLAGKPGDKQPAILASKPPNFDDVIFTAEIYRDDLNRLLALLDVTSTLAK